MFRFCGVVVLRIKTRVPVGKGVRTCAVVLAGLSVAVSAYASTPSQSPSLYSKPVSSRLNQTGRVISLPIAMKDGGNALGEVVVRINPDDSVLIPKGALIDKLTPVLEKSALGRLQGVREANDHVTIADLVAAGFDIKFESGQLELIFSPNLDDRPVGEFSLGRRAPSISASAARPAIFSGYVNVFAGVDHLWGGNLSDERTSANVDVQSVFRMWNIVVENDLKLDGDVDTMTCPTVARCLYEHTAGLKRRRSRLVYDLPDSDIRVQAGDADVNGTTFQRTPDVLGIAIEKSPRKLRPGENIGPTGRSSFRIERPSDIDVMINGVIVNRLKLRPGNYKLSDLPLTTGANQVELIVTDETGERRALTFTMMFDGNLLGAGKSEWSLAGGVPSYINDNERAYRFDESFASGMYRYGLTDQATGEIHLQGDDHVVMGGAGVFSITPWGLFGLQGAASYSSLALGFGANFNYDLINFGGLVTSYTGLRETLRFGAEYRSTDFRSPGEFAESASGILFPHYNYWLQLSSSYTVPFPNSVSATLGARYRFADEKQLILSPYTLKGDRYGVDLTLSSPLTPSMSGSLSVGYSNESHLLTDTTGQDRADFRVMARFYFRPDEKSQITANYDSLTNEAHLSGYRSAGNGIGRWDTSINVQQQGRDNRANVDGSLAYYGNRAEVRLAQTSGFDGFGWNGVGASSGQRSSVRMGTSIAFADGVYGWGQPIRGNGFAIVFPHESIASKTVTVGSQDNVRAKADAWGAAVVPDIPAYAAMTLPVDVDDLPLGYSLGASGFDTYAPYRGGYRLEVGSAYSVSAFGTLLDPEGDPVALLTGVAYPADDPQKKVAIFTNGVGKFGADGLAPGKWIIDLAVEGAALRYHLVVPKGVDGLFTAGTLTPVAKNKS